MNSTLDYNVIKSQYGQARRAYKNGKLSDLQFAEEFIMKNLKSIRKKCKGKVRGNEAKFLQEYKSKYETLLYDCRLLYLEKLNEAYNCDISPVDYLKKHKKELLEEKLVVIVAQEGLINNAFQQVIKELIPVHPKDEYKETRLMDRHFVIHCGGTNTGKTYNAIQALKKADSGVYLAPLRLLALEIFQTLNNDGVPCTLSTGEEDIVVPNSKHTSSTIEKLNIDRVYDVAVIDEAQMVADIQRGNAWTKAILAVRAKEVHICCSPDANNIIIQLIKDCGDTYEVHKYERSVPLTFQNTWFEFPTNVEPGDALVVFSKKMVLRVAGILTDKGIKTSVLYGNLPPDTRRKQMELFINKETDVVVTTDVIGMGLNLPIRRVIFLETMKFAGEHDDKNWELNSSSGRNPEIKIRGRRKLRDTEIKQIAGRAGRKNIFDEGFVNCQRDKGLVRRALASTLPDLTYVYSTPSDDCILSFPIGTLKERLVAWLNSKDTIKYIRKANIDEPLELLEILDNEFEDIPIEDKYRLIFIPFDSKKTPLLTLWKMFVREYLDGEDITFPELMGSRSLDNLEMYYRMLDLYYSFCKEMGKPCKTEETMNIKDEVSGEIHEILRNQMKNMKNKCAKCGRALPWDFPYNICDKCFGKYYF